MGITLKNRPNTNCRLPTQTILAQSSSPPRPVHVLILVQFKETFAVCNWIGETFLHTVGCWYCLSICASACICSKLLPYFVLLIFTINYCWPETPFLLHTKESSISMMLYASGDPSNILSVLNLRQDLYTKTCKLKPDTQLLHCVSLPTFSKFHPKWFHMLMLSEFSSYYSPPAGGWLLSDVVCFNG